MKPAASPRSRQYSQLRPSEDSPLTAYSPLHAARSYTRGVQKTASTRWKWAVGKIEDQYEHYVKRAPSYWAGLGASASLFVVAFAIMCTVYSLSLSLLYPDPRDNLTSLASPP